MNDMSLKNDVGVQVERDGHLQSYIGQKSPLKFGGRFHVEHIRDGKVIGTYEMDNGIVDAGLNNILDVHFHAGTQITTWYIGLINVAGASYSNADTMASHTWTEFTNYQGTDRLAWTEGDPAARSITNGTTVDFTIDTAGGTLDGIFITSNQPQGGATGTLWATALFTADVPVVIGDTLKITYTVSG